MKTRLLVAGPRAPCCLSACLRARRRGHVAVQQPAAQATSRTTTSSTPTDKWLEHVQKSSVRFNSGGSGSFVSADGLVMTNHHVGADCLQKLSDKEHNYYRDGFHAQTQADESASAMTMELNVLMTSRT